MTEPVELHAYDPDWPAAFERERALIAPLFPQAPKLTEHMGSTSVPGLPAKPIIDIIVLVDDLAAGHAAVPALEAAGSAFGGTTRTRPSSISPGACRRRRDGRITCTFMTTTSFG